MELLYVDDRVVVCVKPSGLLSTDEPGGLPDVIRKAIDVLKEKEDRDGSDR